MGQYKVPQDVEAEDKILGPLTLKQFIYGAIGLGWAFLCFFIFARISLILFIIVAAPVTILFGLLAAYRRDGQDFESLLLSLVSFFAQPRQRIWLKEPVAEVFRIEPPKVVVEQTQRDPAEVRSQLEQLANLVDSRGTINQPTGPPHPITIPGLDAPTIVMPDAARPTEVRTIAIPTAQSPTIADIVPDAQDMLDLQHSPGAQSVGNLVLESEQAQKNRAIAGMQAEIAAAPAYVAPVASAGATAIASAVLPAATIAASPSVTAPPPVPATDAPTQLPPTGLIPQTQPTPIAALAPAPPAGPPPIGAPPMALPPAIPDQASTSTSGMTLPSSGDIMRVTTENTDQTVSPLAALVDHDVVISEGETVNLH